MRSVQSQLDSLQATVDNYRQRLPDATGRMGTDLTDGSGEFCLKFFY